MNGKRRLDKRTNDVLALDFKQEVGFCTGCDGTLECHVTSSAARAEVSFLIIGGEDTVGNARSDEAVRLAIHGLGSECRGNQVNFPTC